MRYPQYPLRVVANKMLCSLNHTMAIDGITSTILLWCRVGRPMYCGGGVYRCAESACSMRVTPSWQIRDKRHRQKLQTFFDHLIIPWLLMVLLALFCCGAVWVGQCTVVEGCYRCAGVPVACASHYRGK